MKFSVLIPTRNRLKYLKYAVETVLRQDYTDWELIISDNDSEEDVAGYVRSLNDPRIKYYRTDRFVPVTENWNNALEKSSGNYIIMLGDDDCLLKDCFTIINKLVDSNDNPDFIYTNALIYAYPNVIPEYADGYLSSYDYAHFFKNHKEPFFLRKEIALKMVSAAMNFKMLFTFNMQHSIISRRLINKMNINGYFFQSPYPDFYATNAMFLIAERILICPYPLVVIGISPKSFGYYLINKTEGEGIKFLKNQPDSETLKKLKDILLPGSQDRNSWLIAMEAIKANFKSEFKINYFRYRYLQIIYVYTGYLRTKIFSENNHENRGERLVELKEKMHWWEKLVYVPGVWIFICLFSLFPRDYRETLMGKLREIINKIPKVKLRVNKNSYENILEVFEDIDPKVYIISNSNNSEMKTNN